MTDAELDQLVARLSRDGLRRWVGDICEQAATAITALRERVASDAAWIQAMTNAGIKMQMELDAAQSALAERDRRIAELEANTAKLRRDITATLNEGKELYPTNMAEPWQWLHDEARRLLAERDALALECKALREALRAKVVHLIYRKNGSGHYCRLCDCAWDDPTERHAADCLAQLKE